MNLTIRQPREMLTTGLIVKHLAGSKAYGTSLPTSDTDIRGIFCADEVYHRSPWYTVNEIEIPEEEDTKYYELSNFMKLLVDQNPNILETLWVDDSTIIETSPAYEYLRSKRYELLSSKTAYTFSGYALSQLKRIKGHNKWINNPQPVDQPRQVDFLSLVQNFTSIKLFKMDGDTFIRDYRQDYRLIPYGGDIFGLYKAIGYQTCDNIFTLNTNDDDVDRTKLGFPEMIIKFNKEEYKRVKAEWSNYWTWKKERNVARSELEEQFGYDTKHAMHLIRLLRMGKEILTQGEVIVLRPDAAELLEIRNGKLSYEELVRYAETIDTEIRNELYKNTKLRKRVDPRIATSILFRTQEIAWGR
jgi:predicted nucleotidyltransferase